MADAPGSQPVQLAQANTGGGGAPAGAAGANAAPKANDDCAVTADAHAGVVRESGGVGKRRWRGVEHGGRGGM